VARQCAIQKNSGGNDPNSRAALFVSLTVTPLPATAATARAVL
jgi:hypothetical protein